MFSEARSITADGCLYGYILPFLQLSTHVYLVFLYNADLVLVYIRCGMVYMDPNELGWRPYVKSWMQRTCTKMKDETKVFKYCSLVRLFKRLLEQI